MKDLPMHQKTFKLGKFRGSAFAKAVHEQPLDCLSVLKGPQKKVEEENLFKKWLEAYFYEHGSRLTLKPKAEWPTTFSPLERSGTEEKPKCEGGCQSFSKRGTNAYFDVLTCKVCGHQTKTRKEIMEMYEPDVCPHNVTDSRGSSKKTSRTFCLQCKTFISEIPQEEKHVRKQIAKELELKTSDTSIQAAQQLVEQDDLLLTKEEALASIEHLGSMVADMGDQIKSGDLVQALLDSVDVINERVRRSRPPVAMVAIPEQWWWKRSSPTMPIWRGPSCNLREVDIMTDNSVWAVLDEGCNATCHSKAWRENAEAKWLSQGFVVERYQSRKEYHGVGNKPIATNFCYRMPFNIYCGHWQKSLAGVLESQELPHEGFVPMLLSLPNQATLGLVKDMRNGTCVLQDYGVSTELCICKQNGLLCVNIGDMSGVLHRRTGLLTCLKHLRWGSSEYLQHFAEGSQHSCNVMPYENGHCEIEQCKKRQDRTGLMFQRFQAFMVN